MFYYSFLALAAFLITLLGTRLLVLRLRNKPMLLDIPNPRSNHKIPTPRGGGIAIVITLASYLLAVEISYVVVIGLLLLAGLSLLDDFTPIPALVRLVAQAIVVMLLVVVQRLSLPLEALPYWLNVTLLVLAWLWFINLFNFMDGIDGLAGTEAITIAIGIGFLLAMNGFSEDDLFIYALITASAVGGFLWWNWHPAKIFMGDVGSVPLGFLLGYLLISLASHGFLIAALILPAYFVADASFTLARRFAQGKKVWVAHSEHYYQLAVRSGMAHNRVVFYVTGVNIMLVGLATYATIYPELGLFALFAAYMMVGMVMLFFERHFHQTQEQKQRP